MVLSRGECLPILDDDDRVISLHFRVLACEGRHGTVDGFEVVIVLKFGALSPDFAEPDV